MVTALSPSDAAYLLSRHPEITPEMIANPAPYVQDGQALAIHVSDDFTGRVRDYIISPRGQVYDITATDAGGQRIDPEIAQESDFELALDAIGGGLKQSFDPFTFGSVTNILLIAGAAWVAYKLLKK